MRAITEASYEYLSAVVDDLQRRVAELEAAHSGVALGKLSPGKVHADGAAAAAAGAAAAAAAAGGGAGEGGSSQAQAQAQRVAAGADASALAAALIVSDAD